MHSSTAMINPEQGILLFDVARRMDALSAPLRSHALGKRSFHPLIEALQDKAVSYFLLALPDEEAPADDELISKLKRQLHQHYPQLDLSIDPAEAMLNGEWREEVEAVLDELVGA